MEDNMIFFGEQGLTSTSASFISNMAKEYYRGKEAILNNMQFCNTQVTVLATGGTATISQGVDAETLRSVPQIMDSIAKAKSLIAWLREALKAKEKLVKEAQEIHILDYCKKCRPEMYEAFAHPYEYIYAQGGEEKLGEDIVDEVTGKLTPQQWYDYFYAKNMIKVIDDLAGNPNSTLPKYVDQINDYKVNTLSEDGGMKFESTIDAEELQQRIEELRAAKQSVEVASADLRANVDEEIKNAKNQDFRQANDVRLDVEMAKSEVVAQLELYRRQEAHRLGQLKIAIPDSLKDIYEEIKNLGKK